MQTNAMRITSVPREYDFSKTLRTPLFFPSSWPIRNLGGFAAKTTSELEIHWLDCFALAVYGTQVGVFENTNEISFGSLLKSENGLGLESSILFNILRNLANEMLERKLTNKLVRRLLVTMDLAKGDSSRAIMMGLPCASI